MKALAESLVSGEITVETVVARCTYTFGKRWRWLRPLARRYVTRFSGRTRPRRQQVIQFLLADDGFTRAYSKHFSQLAVEHWLASPHRMLPTPAAAKWEVPKIESVAALAQWLGTDVSYLQWFADLKGLGYKTNRPKLRHYHYRILAKDSRNIRLIEAPKQALKKLQQRILADKIPVHPAAHGFVKGRSIKTYVASHVGRRVLLRMDLRHFFNTFRAARIEAFFRTLGYPESVADLLTGICTNATPRDVWKQIDNLFNRVQTWETRKLCARPHLPQGAPTSPALANLCSYRIDCRLAGLAKSVGAKYSRYADDLAFSGDAKFESCVERFSTHVSAILQEEGFAVNYRKTRIMRQGVRQWIVGLVANKRPNVVRSDFDRLKATLTNCVRHGILNQNHDARRDFRAHLEGRVSFLEMINPARGKRLRRIFDRIQWE